MKEFVKVMSFFKPESLLTFRLGLESLVGGLSKQVVDALKKFRRRGVGDVRLSGLLNNDLYVVDGVEVVLISVKKRDDKVVVSHKPHDFQEITFEKRESYRDAKPSKQQNFCALPGLLVFVASL